MTRRLTDHEARTVGYAVEIALKRGWPIEEARRRATWFVEHPPEEKPRNREEAGLGGEEG